MPRTFRLIGRRMDFRLIREYLAAGFIPSVYGISTCGKFQTCARVEDIEWLF